jgi:hypothetical protein
LGRNNIPKMILLELPAACPLVHRRRRAGIPEEGVDRCSSQRKTAGFLASQARPRRIERCLRIRSNLGRQRRRGVPCPLHSRGSAQLQAGQGLAGSVQHCLNMWRTQYHVVDPCTAETNSILVCLFSTSPPRVDQPSNRPSMYPRSQRSSNMVEPPGAILRGRGCISGGWSVFGDDELLWNLGAD